MFSLQRSQNPLKSRYQQTDNSVELNELSKQLEQQRVAIAKLTQAVQQKHTESYDFRILDELKTLKRSIQKLENGPVPNIPIVLPPPPNYFSQHQQQLFYTPPQYYQQSYQSPYYMQQQQFQQPYQQYFQSPYQQPQSQQSIPIFPKTESSMDQKQKLLKLLQSGQIEIVKKKKPQPQPQQQQQSQQKQKPKQQLKNSNLNSNTKIPQTIIPKSQRIIVNSQHFLKSSQQSRSSKQLINLKQQLEDNQLEIKRISQELNELVDQFDFSTIGKQFIIDCDKDSSLLKNDIDFTTNKQNVSKKCGYAIKICLVLVKKFNQFYQNISETHKNLLKSISTKLLWNGHSKFVVDRLSVNNLFLTQVSKEQSQLILMDYCYNQVFIPKFIMINEWYPKYQSIPKYKEALKILASILQQLQFEQFKKLQLQNQQQEQLYNKSEVLYCDFNNTQQVLDMIDEQNPNYRQTENGSILGLYNTEDIQEVFNESGVLDLQGQFQIENKTDTQLKEIETFISKALLTYYDSTLYSQEMAKNAKYLLIPQGSHTPMREGFYLIIEGDYLINKKFVQMDNMLIVRKQDQCQIIAQTTIKLLAVYNFEIYDIFLRKQKQQQMANFLQKYIFQNISRNAVLEMAKYFKIMRFTMYSKIYQQGEQSSSVSLIREGEVKIMQNNKSVKLLPIGQLVGEYEVFYQKNRQFSAIANSQVILLQIRSEKFLQILRDYTIVRQQLMCQSVIKYRQSYSIIENNTSRQASPTIINTTIRPPKSRGSILLMRQKKILRGFSPKEDCQQIFELSQQIHKDRVKTILKDRSSKEMSRPQTCHTKRTLKGNISASEMKSISFLSPKVITSTQHNMFRSSPSRQLNMHKYMHKQMITNQFI